MGPHVHQKVGIHIHRIVSQVLSNGIILQQGIKTKGGSRRGLQQVCRVDGIRVG